VAAPQTIVIAAAIDERFADPLAVALQSACRRLSQGWVLRVYVTGFEVASAARDRLSALLSGLPVTLEWTEFDAARVGPQWPLLEAAGAVTQYFRLYLGETLPDSTERVLFLDADVLVEGDLAELWQSPFDGRTVQATPDAYAQLFHLSRLRRFGVADDDSGRALESYFNAGVLLIDLKRWRAEDLGGKAATILNRHGDRLLFRDQDALNLALAGKWKPLATTWNFHELPDRLGFWRSSEPREDLSRTFEQPAVIHYVGRKPWDDDCLNHFRDHWRAAAAEAGVYEPPEQTAGMWTFTRLRKEPADLDWLLWRGWIQGANWDLIARALRFVAARPWLLLCYPAWKAQIRLRNLWERGPRWVRRRRKLRSL